MSSLPLSHMRPAAIAELSTSQVADLTADDFAGLGARKVQAFSAEQIAALSEDTLNGLDRATWRRFSATEISELTTSQIGSLDAATISKFSMSDLAALTPDQMAAISPSAISGLGIGKLLGLSGDQLASLSPSTLAAISANKLRQLSVDQMTGLSSEGVAGLSHRQLAVMQQSFVAAGAPDVGAPSALTNLMPSVVMGLSSDAVAAMSVATFDALIGDKVGFLSSLDGVSVDDLNSLNAHAFGQILGADLDGLGGAVLSQLNAANFTGDQLSYLSGSTLSSLSTGFLDGLSGASIAGITPAAVAGLTASQLDTLSPAQLASFTPDQIAAMSPEQTAVIATVNPLVVQATEAAVGGSLTYSGALSFLESAAVGGMSSAKLTGLQAVDQIVMTQDQSAFSGNDDAIFVSPGVKALFDNVVGGLSSTTTQAQFNALIGQQFLGADVPGLQIDSAGDTASATYQQVNAPLYGPSGGPLYTDVVSSGGVNDSALLAGIAEAAFHDPSYIQGLLTDNGNGTTTVELPSVWGDPTFVTVNNQFAMANDGSGAVFAQANGSVWASVLEKAAAQASSGGSYASLTTTPQDAMREYTGQYFSTDRGTAEQAFNAGGDAILAMGGQGSNHTGGDFYAVTSINNQAGTIGVYNPMGGQSTTFSLNDVSHENGTIYTAQTQRAAI